MPEHRLNPITTQCAWCRRIRVKRSWIQERRSGSGTFYSHGICNQCWSQREGPAFPGPRPRRKQG